MKVRKLAAKVQSCALNEELWVPSVEEEWRVFPAKRYG